MSAAPDLNPPGSLHQAKDALALAHKHLLPFIRLDWPDYMIGGMHILIAKALERVESGEIKRLLIHTPPQHGKTVIASEYFPGWFMGRNPHKRIIASSYNAARSVDTGRKVRNLVQSHNFKLVFPHSRMSQDSSAQTRFSMDAGGHYLLSDEQEIGEDGEILAQSHNAPANATRGGEYYATSIGGAATGRGADCLPATAIIDTNLGRMTAERLFMLKYKPLVKTYNHKNDCIEYKQIVAQSVRKSQPNELLEVTLSNGNKLYATDNHKVFVDGKGYVKTNTLRPGDRCLVNVSTLPCSVLSETLRIQQIKTAWSRRFLLLARLFKSASRNQESKTMRTVWSTDTEKDQTILRSVQATEKTTVDHRPFKALFGLWQFLRQQKRSLRVLFHSLCKRSACHTYDGRGKFPLQRWHESNENLSGYAPAYSGSRFAPMHQLWHAARITDHTPSGLRGAVSQQFSDTSHRRRPVQQSPSEFDNALPHLPCGASQVQSVTVHMVRRVCPKSEHVYDFQVADNSNFFADGVLVHNCFLIDDPLKDWEEARSVVRRRRLIDWYQAVAYTRLAPDGAVVIIQTRWHSEDLAGWVIRNDPDFVVINLPALAESNDILGRARGEPLFPERYDLAALQRIKKVTAEPIWIALYQQRPAAELGNIFKSPWLRWRYPIEKLERKRFIYLVASLDSAFKKGQHNDWSVLGMWGVDVHKRLWLAWVGRERKSYPELRDWVRECVKAWRPNILLIEDKASGQSLIQELRVLMEQAEDAAERVEIEAITPLTDKTTRALAVTPFFADRRVLLPPDDTAPWLEDYIDELLRFDSSAFDDQVDMTSQALTWIGRRFEGVLQPTQSSSGPRDSATMGRQMVTGDAQRGATRPSRQPGTTNDQSRPQRRSVRRSGVADGF